MFNSKKIKLIAFFCLLITGTALFAEDEYFINNANSETKAGKVLSGPYDSLEQAVAAWIANNMREDSFYCISQNKKVIATKPSKQISDVYDYVWNEFQADINGTAEKYGVTLKPAALKKLGAEPVKTKKEKTPKEKKSKKSTEETQATEESAENEETAAPEETGEITEATALNKLIDESAGSPAAETEPAPAETEPGNSAEEIPAAVEPETAEAPVTAVEVEPELKTEEKPAEPTAEELAKLAAEKAAAEEEARKAQEEAARLAAEKLKQDEALKIALENANKNQTVSRYQKEYLQDFMKDEAAELPDDYETADEPVITNPDKKDSNNQTLLMKAARAGNEWQVKLLIDSGADTNLRDKDGWTALMYAVRYQESTGVVNLLVSADTDIKAKNNYDSSALLIAACYNNNPEILKKLLSYYSISEKDVLKAFTQILSSTLIPEYIQLAKINIFLEKGIQLNTFYEGKTPLMYAAQYGNSTQVIKLLLDNGCITTVRSTEGKTAFEYASKNTRLSHDDYYWALNKK